MTRAGGRRRVSATAGRRLQWRRTPGIPREVPLTIRLRFTLRHLSRRLLLRRVNASAHDARVACVKRARARPLKLGEESNPNAATADNERNCRASLRNGDTTRRLGYPGSVKRRSTTMTDERHWRRVHFSLGRASTSQSAVPEWSPGCGNAAEGRDELQYYTRPDRVPAHCCTHDDTLGRRPWCLPLWSFIFRGP